MSVLLLKVSLESIETLLGININATPIESDVAKLIVVVIECEQRDVVWFVYKR